MAMPRECFCFDFCFGTGCNGIMFAATTGTTIYCSSGNRYRLLFSLFSKMSMASSEQARHSADVDSKLLTLSPSGYNDLPILLARRWVAGIRKVFMILI
jgi:hypothetical protein